MRADITTIVSSQPHFLLARKGVPEVVISGLSYLKIEGQAVNSGLENADDPAVMMVTRSLLKPWQFLAADVVGDEPYWALGLASHSGQAHHMEQLQRLADVVRVGEDELFCPRQYPMDPAVSSSMRHNGIKPKRLQHPCSGKHLVALAACRQHDFPLDNYWDVDHPLQKRLANLIGQMVGEKPIWVTDSCGLPSVALSARAQVNMWERLASSDDPKYKRLRDIWLGHVRLIGGYGRLESELMEVVPGRVIAKEGADGLLAVVTLASASEPAAACLIKLASGFSQTYLALALWSALTRASELPPVFKQIADHLKSRLEQWVPKDQELVLPPFP